MDETHKLNTLCIQCNHSNYSTHTKLCSICSNIELYNNKKEVICKLSCNDMIHILLHDNKIFSGMVRIDIKKMYELFNEIWNKEYKFLTINKLNILSNLVKEKNSGEIYAILQGYICDWFPTILMANEADTLLNTIAEYKFNGNNNHESMYKYVHAICPFVCDIWNIKNQNSVLLCYYTNFGEMSCPSTLKSLFSLWTRIINYMSLANLDVCAMSVCSFCKKNVMLQQEIIICSSCSQIHHKNCKCLCNDNIIYL